MIVYYTQKSLLSPIIIRGLLWQMMGRDAEKIHSQRLVGAQETPWKRGRNDCRNQCSWTRGEQEQQTESTKQDPQGLTETGAPTTDSEGVCARSSAYEVWQLILGVFVGLLIVGVVLSLTLFPALWNVSSSSVASSLDMKVYAQSYCIVFFCGQLISLGGLLFF